MCYCPQDQQQYSYDSTAPTPSAFSAFLDIHRVLLQLECGPDICGILGLTWVVLSFLFLKLLEEVSKESLALLPCVFFEFKKIMQLVADFVF